MEKRLFRCKLVMLDAALPFVTAKCSVGLFRYMYQCIIFVIIICVCVCVCVCVCLCVCVCFGVFGRFCLDLYSHYHYEEIRPDNMQHVWGCCI